MGSGAWVAQSIEHPTLAFGTGQDPRNVGSSPRQAPHGAWSLLRNISLSPSLCHSPLLTHTLSLFKKKKMGRRHKHTFLQRKYTDGQQTHEQLLNITNDQGCKSKPQ